MEEQRQSRESALQFNNVLHWYDSVMTGRRAFNKRQEEEMKFTSAESSFYPSVVSLIRGSVTIISLRCFVIYQSKMGGGDIFCDVYSAACCRPTEQL